MKTGKKILISAALLAVLSLAAAASVFIAIMLIKIPYNIEEEAYVTDKIQITRNDRGFPRVSVTNRTDLYFALGYIHAKDQLNLMEYHRGLATGAAEKMLPREGQRINNLTAILNIREQSDKILKELSDEEVEFIESYCRGVNYIRKTYTGGEKLHEDWTPEDVIAALILREWSNSFLNNIEFLINVDSTISPVIDRKFRDNRYVRYYTPDQIYHIETLRELQNLIYSAIGIFNRGHALYIDRAYSIESSSSTSLYSYIDSLTVHPSWYPVNIEYKGEKIFAVTSAGMPFFFSTVKRNLSYYHFNINADTQDFFLLRVTQNDQGTFYRSGGRQREFEFLYNPYTGTGTTGGGPFRITDKGPVLCDIFPEKRIEDSIIAVTSVLPGSSYVKFLLNTPFSENPLQIDQAFRQIDAAPKTLLMLSGSGNRKSYAGLFTPYAPASTLFKNGNTPTYSYNPRLTQSAQLRLTDRTGSDLVPPGDLPWQFSRKIITNELKLERLNRLLVPSRVYDDRKIRSILKDSHSVTGEKFTPLFLNLLENNILTSAMLTRIYFNDWDMNSDPMQVAPTIFYSLMYHLVEESYKDVFKKDSSYNMRNSHLLYNDLFAEMTANNRHFFNFIPGERVETRETVFDRSFLNSMRFLNRRMGPMMDDWQWGELMKSNYVIHNPHLSYLAYIFKYENVPLTGGPDTLMTTRFDETLTPVLTTSLFGYNNAENRRFTINYGYSTNIASEFYYGRSAPIDLMHTVRIKKYYETIIRQKEMKIEK